MKSQAQRFESLAGLESRRSGRPTTPIQPQHPYGDPVDGPARHAVSTNHPAPQEEHINRPAPQADHIDRPAPQAQHIIRPARRVDHITLHRRLVLQHSTSRQHPDTRSMTHKHHHRPAERNQSRKKEMRWHLKRGRSTI